MGPGKDTHGTLGPISGKAVGGPNTIQHNSTVQKHGKHGSGALSTRALVTRVCCVLADPETSVLFGCLFEQ